MKYLKKTGDRKVARFKHNFEDARVIDKEGDQSKPKKEQKPSELKRILRTFIIFGFKHFLIWGWENRENLLNFIREWFL
ncbi:hypothetical protein PSm6_11630 [Pseudomonas solani]|uniref:Uncharacterized protein n=1 Tax=Pseudomonas solani TaxID=2731552 RepID=A0ABM7L5K1_9PSED|nr:hypothetical protein [Pseudomonas solani]BCD84756.1 hypothetical protein PSm6_11630 [Pseudomonas solani]